MRFKLALLAASSLYIAQAAEAAPVKFRHGPTPPPPAGCPFGVSFADGCPGAPTGTVLFPTMRATYSTQPGWNVPGWEYPVGPPAGTVFKVPGVDACPANVDCSDTTNKLFRLGAGANIDAWGFDNGWSIYTDTGCSNVTIKNSKFKQISTSYGLLRLTNICTGGGLIANNDFNGNGIEPINDTQLQLDGAGAYTVQYNYIHNSFSDHINTTGAGVATSILMQYNVMVNAGASNNPGVHGDWLQQTGTGSTFSPVVAQFNLIIQNDGRAYVNGFGCGDQNFIPTCDNLKYDNNVIVYSDPVITGLLGYPANFNKTYITSNGELKNNYMDTTGMSFGPCVISGTGPATITISGNLNMKTGAALTC